MREFIHVPAYIIHISILQITMVGLRGLNDINQLFFVWWGGGKRFNPLSTNMTKQRHWVVPSVLFIIHIIPIIHKYIIILWRVYDDRTCSCPWKLPFFCFNSTQLYNIEQNSLQLPITITTTKTTTTVNNTQLQYHLQRHPWRKILKR